jgi:hypothetical protein
MKRDPAVDIYVFLDEAVEALHALLPEDTSLRSLVFLVIAVMIDHDGGQSPRQTHLDDLHETFAAAVDEAESETPLRAPQS